MDQMEQAKDQTARNTLALLHRTSVIAVIVIISVASFGIYRSFESYVIQSAEADAIRVSEAFLAFEQAVLLRADQQGQQRLSIDAAKLAQLDTSLKRLALPFDIIKIKIFSPQAEVVYSTDRSLMGQRDAENSRLRRSLNGYYDSSLQYRGEAYDLTAERRFEIDVVESYVPIRNAHHEVVGSFEVYQDITRYRNDVIKGVVTSIAVLVVIIAAVFSSAYLVLRQALNRLASTQRQLYQLTTRDGLTGLLNRDETLRRARGDVARYRRERQVYGEHPVVSLMLLDIDHFAQVNDLHGHQLGDAVLQQVADLIQAQLRDYNEVGRYGGESFMVLMPGSSPSDALNVADRIRIAAAELSFRDGDESFSVTLSVGVATVAGDEELDALVRRASISLYAAKERGRNRVEMLGGERSI